MSKSHISHMMCLVSSIYIYPDFLQIIWHSPRMCECRPTDFNFIVFVCAWDNTLVYPGEMNTAASEPSQYAYQNIPMVFMQCRVSHSKRGDINHQISIIIRGPYSRRKKLRACSATMPYRYRRHDQNYYSSS